MIVVVIVLAILAGIFFRWWLRAESEYQDLEQENGRLRLANQTQAKKLTWLESDLAEADVYRMVARREEFDANRNIASPSPDAVVISDGDLTEGGLVKSGEGDDLYIDHPTSGH